MLSRLVFSQRLSVAFISLTNSYINMVNIDSIVATPSPESNDEIETVPPKKFRPSTPPVPPSEVTDVIVSYVKSTDDIKAPYRGSAAAAGVDLHAAEKVIIAANDKKLVSTGIKLALPTGTYGRVAPRSGLAFNHQIDVGAGVVDEDYRGEVKVLLFNCGQKDFTVEIGDRIAQFIVQQISSTKPLVSPVSEVVEIRRARDDVKYPTIENNAIIVYAAEDGVIPAKGFHPFPTAIHIALPTGYYGHASPLTPLATDHGLDLYAGVIDEDYRGELKVLLANRSDSPYTIKAGDAIMQILVEKIANATYQLTTELTETVRGAGGFGSTGVSTTIDAAGDAPIDETVSIPRAVTFTKISDDAQIPVYGTDFAAGADVYANNDTTIPAGGRAIISTGIKLTVAPGYYARVAPRSGLAVKNAIDVGAGVEWTSEEELKVLLFNYGTEAFVVKKGDRIAQIVGEQIAIPELTIVETLSETQRGEAGFGSTGVAAVPEGAKVSTA